ncbi:MAG TPA: hypothetical protein VF538_04635 [Pyrinomonadaceae bacterium]|jgi:hypothetical protein
MNILALEKHVIWSRPDGNGGTAIYYYYDAVTWIVGAVALAWLAWFFVSRHRRARAMRRPPRRTDHRLLQHVVKLKSEVSARYLPLGISANIHAVGVGLTRGGEYCIQVFISDANQELWAGAGAATLPPSYGGVPIRVFEARRAELMSDAGLGPPAPGDQYPGPIREHQEVLVGGISGAHTNLTGQSGTIGYFCTRRSILPRRTQKFAVSCTHVFADLRKTQVDEGDLIVQPSPGESCGNRPVATLVDFAPIKFDGTLEEPNHVDAAIARLWGQQPYKPVVPCIGAARGYVEKKDIEIGEPVRKFGRTTGGTEGCIFSTNLDIWIGYSRTGQSAFFQNQLLIEPTAPAFTKFVEGGDSGSLLFDAGQHVVGLIFAGTPDAPETDVAAPEADAAAGAKPPAERPPRIESYGVANPISEVLDRLGIDLLIQPTE